MKKSELKEIIREEIQKLKEGTAHHFQSNGKWYVDSNFVNFSKGVIKGSELRHLGMGNFELVTPKGIITFDRMGAKKFDGQVGRSHRTIDDAGGKTIERLIQAMAKARKSELVKEEILKEGQYSNLKIYQFVPLIKNDWGTVSPYAKPYLDAMRSLKTLDDKYILDSGSGIVAYFLSNAASWKGQVARDVKKELKMRLKKYYRSRRI